MVAVELEECFGLHAKPFHLSGFTELSYHLFPLCTGQADVEVAWFPPVFPPLLQEGAAEPGELRGTYSSMRPCHAAVSRTATPSHCIFTRFSEVLLTLSPPALVEGASAPARASGTGCPVARGFFAFQGDICLSPHGIFGIYRPRILP